MVAQLARKPLMEDAAVGTELVIGPKVNKPLVRDIPLLVSNSAPTTSRATSISPSRRGLTTLSLMAEAEAPEQHRCYSATDEPPTLLGTKKCRAALGYSVFSGSLC